ncbi:MAG: hypothetical protein Pars2KO_05410 [Parasphingorhabdus sp.]
MSATVFDPKAVEVGDIGAVMMEKITNPGLREFMAAKGKEDGNLSAIVVDDSDNMGVGVGTWDAGQNTTNPVPLMFDEVLFIVEGRFWLEIEGERQDIEEGQCAHLAAGQFVRFGSDDGCRLVWVTSPPTWVALQRAFEEGKMGGVKP